MVGSHTNQNVESRRSYIPYKMDHCVPWWLGPVPRSPAMVTSHTTSTVEFWDWSSSSSLLLWLLLISCLFLLLLHNPQISCRVPVCHTDTRYLVSVFWMAANRLYMLTCLQSLCILLIDVRHCCAAWSVYVLWWIGCPLVPQQSTFYHSESLVYIVYCSMCRFLSTK